MEHLPLEVRVPIEKDNPSICRKEELCIKCGQCKEVCSKDIGVHGTYNFAQTGGKAICINCGHIVEGEEAPDVCPACNYAKSFFEVHAENY